MTITQTLSYADSLKVTCTGSLRSDVVQLSHKKDVEITGEAKRCTDCLSELSLLCEFVEHECVCVHVCVYVSVRVQSEALAPISDNM